MKPLIPPPEATAPEEEALAREEDVVSKVEVLVLEESVALEEETLARQEDVISMAEAEVSVWRIAWLLKKKLWPVRKMYSIWPRLRFRLWRRPRLLKLRAWLPMREYLLRSRIRFPAEIEMEALIVDCGTPAPTAAVVALFCQLLMYPCSRPSLHLWLLLHKVSNGQNCAFLFILFFVLNHRIQSFLKFLYGLI